MLDVPVLIVGAGPVGLISSIFLSRFGVRSLLVERHPDASPHEKARSIKTRTMEVFRQCGLDETVRRATGVSYDELDLRIWAFSLAGAELNRRKWAAVADDLSPVTKCWLAQRTLEAILREHAESSDVAQLMFGTELISVEQDDEGVTGTIRGQDGKAVKVRAKYLIAADGASSRVRESLGIPLEGYQRLYGAVNSLVRADLTPWVADRPAAIFYIAQPDLHGTLCAPSDVPHAWGFYINDLSLDTKTELSNDEVADAFRKAVGVSQLDVQVLSSVPWVAAHGVARQSRLGRIFLAGDAVHVTSPIGGLNMNTGIQDAHNLAWKVAAVINGWAGSGLLDTYQAERLPFNRFVAKHVLRATTRVMDADRGVNDRFQVVEGLGVVFGASYDSDAVIPDGTPPLVLNNPVTDYVPNARPGNRAPHVWFMKQNTQVSSLDLFGKGFVLLTGPSGTSWCDAGRAAAKARGIPFEAFTIGPNGDLTDPEERWCELYGVSPDGAVLARPDGHVGWRSASLAADAAEQIDQALQKLTCA